MRGTRSPVEKQQSVPKNGTLKTPAGVAGAPRDPNRDDRDLLVDWVQRFFQDAFGQLQNDGGEAFVHNAYRDGHRFVLWEVDGTPVSVAMLRVPAEGVSRIGPVFTPRHKRGHGYGSAVTAAAAQLARGSGTPDVVLFADLANPTSNAIYQRIGFEGVVDSVRIDFVTVD
jgi:predicted GNAT family acetyltransferase